MQLIVELTGFSGRVLYDASEPGGNVRRLASTSRADEILGFKASIDMREGLQRTIALFRAPSSGTRRAAGA